jgi:hypothetical protein
MTDQEAKTIITSSASYASLRSIEPEGIAFTVTAQKTNFLPLILILSITGPLGLAGGLWLLVKPPAFFAEGPMSDAPVKIIIMSCLITVMGPMLLLIRLVTGPQRNAEFQAAPGEIIADRYIAGDHVRSAYTAAEVRCLFLESNVLFIETRMGNSQLIAYGTAPVNQAIAYMLARHCWPHDQIRVKKVKGPMFSHIPEKTILYPEIRTNDPSM